MAFGRLVAAAPRTQQLTNLGIPGQQGARRGRVARRDLTLGRLDPAIHFQHASLRCPRADGSLPEKVHTLFAEAALCCVGDDAWFVKSRRLNSAGVAPDLEIGPEGCGVVTRANLDDCAGAVRDEVVEKLDACNSVTSSGERVYGLEFGARKFRLPGWTAPMTLVVYGLRSR